MSEQYYRITLLDAIAKYKAGDITAKGLVHFYILIKCKPGWKIRLHHQQVRQELGIAKTAFYNAISRLRHEGSIDWEAPKGVLVSISSSFRECGNCSATTEIEFTNAETDSATTEIEFTNAETDSATTKTKSVNPLLNKGSSNSPDLLTNSYQLFINSLSEREREEFLKFGEQKARQLSHPPSLPRRWIEANWQELSGQWYKSKGQVPPAQNCKWETDPRTRDWLAIIEETANPLEFIDGDPEKFDFVRWAKETKQFSWLKGES